jgi:hypothetical protein
MIQQPGHWPNAHPFGPGQRAAHCRRQGDAGDRLLKHTMLDCVGSEPTLGCTRWILVQAGPFLVEIDWQPRAHYVALPSIE